MTVENKLTAGCVKRIFEGVRDHKWAGLNETYVRPSERTAKRTLDECIVQYTKVALHLR